MAPNPLNEMHAQVVAVGPKDMRMFYHSFDAAKQRWTVGTAASKDGFVWKKAGPIFSGSESPADFDGRGAAACHVVRDFTTKRCDLLLCACLLKGGCLIFTFPGQHLMTRQLEL